MNTSDAFEPLHRRREASTVPLPFVFQGGQLLLDENAPQLPAPHVLEAAGIDLDSVHCVGAYEGRMCLALAIEDGDPPPGTRRVGLRSSLAEIGDDLFGIAGRAIQVVEWDRSHRYCGRCGAPTEFGADERVRRCVPCKASYYPRIAPAVMVLVQRGREVLLARSPRHAPGQYSAVAGFVEPGETLEQTCAREVREEVGVEIDGLQYFASQPWPFPHSLMLAFTARYAGGKLMPDGVEIEDAKWFDVDALPRLPMPISIAYHLITTTTQRLRASPSPG